MRGSVFDRSDLCNTSTRKICVAAVLLADLTDLPPMALLLRSALRCRSARPAGRAARLAATAHRPAAVRWLSDDGAAAAEGQHDEDRMEELLELASVRRLPPLAGLLPARSCLSD